MIARLFLTFVKIGAFNFGGGYAILPLIEKEIVHNNRWMLQEDFIDIVALSQMTPGPISINSATFVGYRISGLLGALAGTVGVILPAYFLVIFAAQFISRYRDSQVMKGIFYGLRPAVVGLIGAATITVGRAVFKDMLSVVLALVAGVMVFKTKINPVLIILISGLLGTILFT